MERYDGKTKKDDYKKYALIALGVVAVLILYKVTTHVIYKVSHPTPDMSIVVACAKVVDFQMEDQLEAYLSPLVGDLDGNGKAVADVVPLRAIENEAMAQSGVGAVGAESDISRLQAYIAGSDEGYRLFLVSDEPRDGYAGAMGSCCTAQKCRELPEDLQSPDNPYCTELTGAELLVKPGLEKIPFYGCIQKDATEEEYDLCVEILRQLKAA